MNEFKMLTNIPKNVLIKIFFVILIAAFVLWIILGYMNQSAGLSGQITTAQLGMDKINGGVYERNEDFKKGNAGTNIGITTPVPGSAATPPLRTAMIVKSGELTLLVKNIETTANKITEIRTSYAGQPGNSNFSTYGNGVKQGDITIWVPSERFDDAMSAIKNTAQQVSDERVSVQDVSAQYVDLDARLKNLKGAEVQYQEILKRSGKISDVLEVTNALVETRSQIEQLQGQLDFLSHQVTLSSIHITLSEEPIPSNVSNEWRPLLVAKGALKETLSGLTDSINTLIVLLIALPLFLFKCAFWILVVYGIVRVSKKLYHFIFKPSEQK
jgi:hypothetical protein